LSQLYFIKNQRHRSNQTMFSSSCTTTSIAVLSLLALSLSTALAL